MSCEETLDRIREIVLEYLRRPGNEQDLMAAGYLLVIAEILEIRE